MRQQELLAYLADGLEAMGTPFMVAGSHASSLHGQPRATNDIDLVIEPTAEELERWFNGHHSTAITFGAGRARHCRPA